MKLIYHHGRVLRLILDSTTKSPIGGRAVTLILHEHFLENVRKCLHMNV